MTSTKRGRKKKDELRLPSMLSREDIDAMAKRRCLMLLAVLSGQLTISQAIKDAKISSGTYYQLEARALTAMLEALAPMTPTESGESRSKSYSSLQSKVKKLEIDKRRLERLLAMASKIVRPGPMKTDRGRKTGKTPRTRSTRSTRSMTKKSMDNAIEQDQPSTPTPTGAAAP